MKPYMLLDDFSSERSALNNLWEGFTDRVMGGVSDLSVEKVSDDQGHYIRMTGKVSLENNGGFIQIRQKLTNSLNVFDGSHYQGVRLKARGIGSHYYIFLRTTSTLLPWQYYSAEIDVNDTWNVVDIPWTAFKKGDYGNWGLLKANKLKSIAIVAYGDNFDAQIDVMEIGFY